MKNDTPIIVEEDNGPTDAEAVRNYLEAQKLTRELKVNALMEESEDDTKLRDLEVTTSEADAISPDTSFETDNRTNFDNMVVSVMDSEVPVTDQDKLMYLKATLNDCPVILDVTMLNGLEVTCRSLSVYEHDLTYDALQLYAKDYENGINAILVDSIVQQFRLTMQITKFNNKSLEYSSFTFGEASRAEHARKLVDASNAFIQNQQSLRYGLMLRALNVFQHKMSKLQSAAFNSDFWTPDGTVQ